MNKDDDPVKKIFGKTAKEIFDTPKQDHSKFHSGNAFCGSAGPEEMKHLRHLVAQLSDKELAHIVEEVGISFGVPADKIDRDNLDSVIDEADIEVFYREYHKIIESKR